MNAKERREDILKRLCKADKPISASVFAELYGVSRQVIVGDVAMLRASGVEINALVRGYYIEKRESCSKIFKVLHSDEEVEKELGLIVDLGGKVEDVFVFHRVYGKLSAPMGIETREQIKQFLAEIASGKSSLLKNVTAGYHYHTVSAPTKEIIEKIEKALLENGLLAPLKSFEPIGIGENRY
jgi:transcriptional regulator of NAD metabolism